MTRHSSSQRFYRGKGERVIRIQLNGQEVELPEEVRTVSPGRRNTWEWRKRSLWWSETEKYSERQEHDSTFLAEGDSIEIVHFVGGGQ